MIKYQGAIILAPPEGYMVMDFTGLYPYAILSYPIDDLGEEE
jgi:hypothetical protein